MARSFEACDLPLPPWREHGALVGQWLVACAEDERADPAPATISTTSTLLGSCSSLRSIASTASAAAPPGAAVRGAAVGDAAAWVADQCAAMMAGALQGGGRVGAPPQRNLSAQFL
jgi:uncharacterized lipoprotein YbaY